MNTQQLELDCDFLRVLVFGYSLCGVLKFGMDHRNKKIRK